MYKYVFDFVLDSSNNQVVSHDVLLDQVPLLVK